MSPLAAAIGLLFAPLVWAYGFTVAALATLVDLTSAKPKPHDPALDTPPPTRNASLIVLNFEGEDLLPKLLPSLQATVAATPGDHEILVVDNGSTDGSCALVERDFPDVRLIRLPENRYFIRGNRAGVEAARGDILVFVNNDMVVEREFLQHLLTPFDDGRVFATTAQIKMADPRTETGCTRAVFRSGAFHFVQVQPNAPSPVPALWAGGGSSAFDRRKWDAIGGFETLYEPCYVEDVSLSYQAWKRGWHVLYEERSVVHHAHQTTSSRVFGRRGRDRIDWRNRELFFWRSVTDRRMTWAHALWLPWNLIKQARRTGIEVQLTALLRTISRLGPALRERTRSRSTDRRSDRDALQIAQHIGAFRRGIGHRANRPPVAVTMYTSESSEDPPGVRFLDEDGEQVSLGFERPPARAISREARFHRIPPRFANAVGNSFASDAARNIVCDTAWDFLCILDPWALAASPRGGLVGATVWWLDPLHAPRDPAEQRFMRELAGRVQHVIADDESVVARYALQDLAKVIPVSDRADFFRAIAGS